MVVCEARLSEMVEQASIRVMFNYVLLGRPVNCSRTPEECPAAAATRFAWDEQRAMLAIVVKRKLMLYHYDSKEFVELKELSLPDTPLCMQWCGEHIVVGFKKE